MIAWPPRVTPERLVRFPYKIGPDGLNETTSEREAKEGQKAGKQTCTPFCGTSRTSLVNQMVYT